MKNLTVKLGSVNSREVAKISQIAGKSVSDVFVEMNEKRFDAKSILGILSLALKAGDEFTIISEDEQILQEIKAEVGAGE